MAAALIVALVVALATHRLSLGRESESRRKNACEKFANSVVNCLSGLYPEPNDWPQGENEITKILESKFSTLQSVVIEFRPHIVWYKRWCFDRAWNVYRLGKEGQKIGIQDYWQYTPYSEEGIENGKHYKVDNTQTYQSNFKKNVDRLLKFAK